MDWAEIKQLAHDPQSLSKDQVHTATQSQPILDPEWAPPEVMPINNNKCFTKDKPSSANAGLNRFLIHIFQTLNIEKQWNCITTSDHHIEQLHYKRNHIKGQKQKQNKNSTDRNRRTAEAVQHTWGYDAILMRGHT